MTSGCCRPHERGAARRRGQHGGAAETELVMKVDVGLDTGDVAMAERIAITDRMTASDLHDALSPLGAGLMVRAMAALEQGTLQLTKQPTTASPTPQDRQGRGAGSTGTSPRTKCCAISMDCRAFPGAWCRSRRGRTTGAAEDPAL